MFRFYVYALCYPCGTPFYIGKGQKDRIDDHEKDTQKGRGANLSKKAVIRHIQESGQQVLKHKIAEFSNEHEAYMYEWALIYMTAMSEHLTNCLNIHHHHRNIPLKPSKRKILKEQQKMSQEKRVYTVHEIAQLYNTNEMTVLRNIRAGKLKAFKTSGDTGAYRIKLEDLEAFEQESMLEVSAQQGA